MLIGSVMAGTLRWIQSVIFRVCQRVEQSANPRRRLVVIDPRRKVVPRLVELSFGLPERRTEPVTPDPRRRGADDSLNRRRMLRIVDLRAAVAGSRRQSDGESKGAQDRGFHARPEVASFNPLVGF